MAELTRRYVVMTVASEVPFDPNDPDGVFVLKPWKDPAALRAIQAYRDNCYPELACDLDTWVAAIAAGPSVRGDVGRRNDPHLRAMPPTSSTAASSPSRRGTASRAKTTRATRKPAAKATPPRRATKRKKRAR